MLNIKQTNPECNVDLKLQSSHYKGYYINSGVARAFVMPGPASMVQEKFYSKIRKLSQEHKADARAQARVGPGLATPLIIFERLKQLQSNNINNNRGMCYVLYNQSI